MLPNRILERKMKRNVKQNKAFTLAEVLITLGVIGIVAALTIPTLINNNQESQYNTGIKKAMSELSNALNLILVNNSGVVNVGTPEANADFSLFRDEFCDVMKCIKKDKVSEVFGPTVYKFYKGNDWYAPGSDPGATSQSAILSDGAFMYFASQASCDAWGINSCGYIWVDINGAKNPNMWGRDLYQFNVVKKASTGSYSILPAGTANDTYNADTHCIIGAGDGCAAVRLADPSLMP